MSRKEKYLTGHLQQTSWGEIPAPSEVNDKTEFSSAEATFSPFCLLKEKLTFRVRFWLALHGDAREQWVTGSPSGAQGGLASAASKA